MRIFLVTSGIIAAGAAAITTWIASPVKADLELPPPLAAWTESPGSVLRDYDKDLRPLSTSFRPQIYRSFCGPASVSTVLGAYGVKHADQTNLFPSLPFKLNAFYTGLTLRELAHLAESTGLISEVVYADAFSVTTFRERLKDNLRRQGDYVLVNYDRRALKQAGAGHISPVGAYDVTRDAFLILDEAAYRYPFTWVPTELLYQAIHTRDGDHYRGVLFVSGYLPPSKR